jgi:hypothetical protein
LLLVTGFWLLVKIRNEQLVTSNRKSPVTG